jgi:hypothetical protein
MLPPSNVLQITVTVPDITQLSAFYLKQDVSGTGFVSVFR